MPGTRILSLVRAAETNLLGNKTSCPCFFFAIRNVECVLSYQRKRERERRVDKEHIITLLRHILRVRAKPKKKPHTTLRCARRAQESKCKYKVYLYITYSREHVGFCCVFVSAYAAYHCLTISARHSNVCVCRVVPCECRVRCADCAKA